MLNHADQILPGLWLGDITSAHDINFLKKQNISVIINCTKDIPFTNHLDVYKYRLPVDDSLKNEDIIKMTESLHNVLEFLNYTYTGKTRNVLVHCFAGMQRSAIVVAAFLYRLRQVETDNDNNFGHYYLKQQNTKWAFNYIIAKRKQAFAGGKYINFKKSFENYFRIQID